MLVMKQKKKLAASVTREVEPNIISILSSDWDNSQKEVNCSKVQNLFKQKAFLKLMHISVIL